MTAFSEIVRIRMMAVKEKPVLCTHVHPRVSAISAASITREVIARHNRATSLQELIHH